MENPVSGSVTPTDIIGIIRHASNYINRDKNELCKVLDAIASEIDNFYYDINKLFGKETAKIDVLRKSYTMSEQNAEPIKEFLKAYRHSTNIDAFVFFIEHILKRYNAGELRRIADRIDSQQLKILSDRIIGFRQMVQDKKVGFYKSLLFPEESDIERARSNIEGWLDGLNYQREKQIRRDIMELKRDLGCQIL